MYMYVCMICVYMFVYVHIHTHMYVSVLYANMCSKNIELTIGRMVSLNSMVSPFSPLRPWLKYHGAAC